LNDFAGFDDVWRTFFKTPPARTTIGTGGLLIKDALIEIDLIGYVPNPELKVKQVKSQSPVPLANYSEGFAVGDMIFAAGQLASDFQSGVAPEAKKHPAFPYYGSDIKLQTEYVLKNLARTFAAAGSSLDEVIKAQVFLTDLKNFNGFDEVWKQYFKTPPARTTVGTTGLLVKDTLVEIDLIGAKRS
jgi:reactive intermediate/imine deaminase